MNTRRVETDRPYDLMTIENAVELGLKGVILYCRKCHREGQASFNALALPLTTPVPAIAKARRFVCSGCGGRAVVSLPDWPPYKATGAGGVGRRDGADLGDTHRHSHLIGP